MDQITDAGGTSLIIDGIDLKQCIEDSILRYYYGAVPSDKEIEGGNKKKTFENSFNFSRICKIN